MRLFKIRLSILALICAIVSLKSLAQESDFKINVGVSAGYNINKNVGDIFVPEDYYSNYEFKDNGNFILGGNMLCIYHKPNTCLGTEGGFAYYQKFSNLDYSDNQGLKYTVKQHYHYFGIMAAIKVYPWKHGLSISAGGRIAAILTPKGIAYSSNQEDDRFSIYEWATTYETERHIKDKLTGSPDASVGGGIGYEFPYGFNLCLRYHYGLTSVIRTELNDFNWVEKGINSHSLEFSVGYIFNL